MSVLQRVSAVPDPELPFLSIADLGILRSVTVDGQAVRVQITPTYSGCPAMAEISADIVRALPGFDVIVETVLAPAWTTDWITERGRAALAEHGVAPPSRVPVVEILSVRPGSTHRQKLHTVGADVVCPQCGSPATEELSRFSSTSCKGLWRCTACREPFEHFKAH